MAPRISVVIPVCNEEQVLVPLHERLSLILDRLPGAAEVVFVDDGSTDGSWLLLQHLARCDPRIVLVSLSRNFGHQIAITAGIDRARGDAVIVMDGDLQDPPEVLPDLIAAWEAGSDVVHARRRSRAGESRFKVLTAAVYYRVLDRLTDVDMPHDVGDFRLLDRSVADALRSMREHGRYVRGMVAWAGFRQTTVEFDRAPRHAGETKYPLSRMLRFAADGLLSFSTAPLRLVLNLGFLMSALAVLGGVASVAIKVSGWFTVPGWTSIVFALGLLSGVQLMVLGVIGHYIARIHEEVKDRPLYLLGQPSTTTQAPSARSFQGSSEP